MKKYILIAIIAIIFSANTSFASNGNPDFPSWPTGTLCTSSGTPYRARCQVSAPPFGFTMTDANPIFHISAVNETNYSDPTNGGSTGSSYLFSDAQSNYNISTDGVYLATVFDQYSTKTVAWQNEITVSGGMTIFTPESLVPADGFVSQITPVDGQNNYTTITFTGTYADSTGRFERIFVTFNDVYPVVSATSFTKLYTIPAQSGASINYSFTETFIPGHTYEYQMLLAEADGSGQTSLTTAQAFGTSSSTQIDGITISGNGTLSNSATDGTITGSGTSFTTQLKIGDQIVVGGETCTVLSIISDTLLECTEITGANSGANFTFSTPITTSITYNDCGTFDIFCHGKNLLIWFFGVSPGTLENFSNLTLQNSLPFSYIYDLENVYDELFANGGSMNFEISVDTAIGEIDLISPTMLSAVPFASTVKTILGYLMYLFTAMTLYHLILRVHSQNHA